MLLLCGREHELSVIVAEPGVAVRLVRRLYAAVLAWMLLLEARARFRRGRRRERGEAAYVTLLRSSPPRPCPARSALTVCVLTAAPPLATAGRVAATTP
jgi:hypothetical protein